jgi:hypothetical protein
MSKSTSICLSGVANAVERIDLGRTTMPAATESYQAIPHDVLVNMVEDKMQENGFVFGQQSHALWRDQDARYFGNMELLHDNGNDQFALMLGIRNSYDKSISAQLLLGANVWLCANMSYSAANVVGRKHTTHIMRDLPGMIDMEVRKTTVFAAIQEERFERYQDHALTDTRADRLMIQMIRSGAVNTSRFDKVVKEWYDPKFDHGSKKVWRLFNAVTEALKGSPVHDLPRRTLRLQSLMDDEVRFEPQLPE